MNDDLNFYKKNGYLVKNNLIPQELLNRINKIVKEVITKEKRKKIILKIKLQYKNMIIIILFTILVN